MPNRIAQGGKNNGGIEQQLPVGIYMPVAVGTVSGDIVVADQLVGYAQTDRDSDGYATVYIPCDVAEVILVYGRTDGADSAVAIGNLLYADVADGQVNKDVTNGIVFGYALGTVTSGESDDILVGFGQ
ncbi:MAG: DUF2190 family protein [Planctomycetes bacterium]|nr:DUF2190 family protein [Planctomycetota bacterium]